ncbi:phage shock protein C (PspC) family protein [Haloechinothrix alba]|uniref:Phage shock protein C (PspC) family protein n=2 Tax=Haloechinothrix TaxID=1425377 RepID=A0A238XC43_9PSEU|nr:MULTISPECIES: PspC domain-containing protein [Haloechinothrix]MBA0127722.1 PspC domain-containing protein [Haloechinothrix aidingensis]SNR56270.1 phage shock protein C (PspC) family protein [Haloechinothrix alba]
MTNNDFNPQNLKRIRRSKSNRMIAGVCGGIADYFGIEAIIVRIVLVATALIALGAPLVLYAIGWLLIPEEETI